MTKLTAIVLTYNEADHIEACLDSLQFADERIVIDSHSTDNTVELARSRGAQVIRNAFENFATQRNVALATVANTTDWILFVDADERVSPELAEEIRQVIMRRDHVAYQIPRHNYIFGKLTKGAGWYPDYQTRLLKAGNVQYANPVHEVVHYEGTCGTLQNPFIHHNYRDLDHFIAKQRQYAQYDAQMMFDDQIKPRPHNYLLQPLRQFNRRFFKLKGYQEGWHGLRLSALMAWYEWRKHIVLSQLWQNKPQS